MLPLNHKRTTTSLAPPIFCVAKNLGNKKIEGSPLNFCCFLIFKNSFSIPVGIVSTHTKAEDVLILKPSLNGHSRGLSDGRGVLGKWPHIKV